MTELTEKRNELSYLQESIAAVTKAAGNELDISNVETIGTEDVKSLDTMAKVEKIRVLNDRLDDVGKEVSALVSAEKALTRKFDTAEPTQAIEHPTSTPEAKSFGQQLVGTDWYQDVKSNGTKEGQVSSTLPYSVNNLKTLFATSAGLAAETTRSGLLVLDAQRQPNILDVIPSTPTTQAAFVYLEESTFTNNAAEAAEGAQFGEAAFVLTETTSTVRKIAVGVPTTDEQLADEPMVSGYLADRLEFMLRQRLDSQLLVGNGSAPNLRGVLNVSGIQTTAKGSDPTFDAAYTALNLVQSTGRAEPSIFIFHPNDWAAIRTTRTSDGLYILGNPSESGTPRLWGLPVVTSTACTENTGICMDTSFSILAEREGINIATGFVDDDFSKGRVHVRGTLRAAFAVTRPAAVCSITGI